MKRRLTVNALLEKLQKLVDQGHGRCLVCVDRDTFKELEDDSVNLMHTHNVEFLESELVNDDGSDVTREDGSVRTRMTAVIVGPLKSDWRGQ